MPFINSSNNSKCCLYGIFVVSIIQDFIIGSCLDGGINNETCCITQSRRSKNRQHQEWAWTNSIIAQGLPKIFRMSHQSGHMP